MASLYKHPLGFLIRYHIYFADGTHQVKTKVRKKKSDAIPLKEDATTLEMLSGRRDITHDELIHFQHVGLISEEEAVLIAGEQKIKNLTWLDLKTQYENYSQANHTAQNIKSVRCRLNNLGGYFGGMTATGITTDLIFKWQALRRESASPKTIKLERDILNQILDFAVEKGVIPFNPGRSKILKGTLRVDNARLPVALTYDETKTLLESALNSKLLGGQIHLATLVYLFGGLRRAEGCYLTYKDIRGEEIIIQSKEVSKKETSDPDVTKQGMWLPKGNRVRVVDLPPKIAAKIRTLLKGEGRFIFGGDHVYHKDYITGEFEKLLKPINPALSLQCLRHTFVTWRIEHGLSGKGDNLVRVQLVAGHADIQTTMRYTHIKISPEKNILDLV